MTTRVEYPHPTHPILQMDMTQGFIVILPQPWSLGLAHTKMITLALTWFPSYYIYSFVMH